MNQIFKIAKEMEKKVKSKKDSAKLMNEYLGKLRGLTIIHQTAHWLTNGENFYGKHLLFDRIYNSVSEDMDKVAEKLVGVFNEDALDPKVHADVAKEMVFKYDSKDFTERSLEAEIDFLVFSEELYNTIKKNGDITLGLDDLIMSVSSNHEENVYLLKQQSL